MPTRTPAPATSAALVASSPSLVPRPFSPCRLLLHVLAVALVAIALAVGTAPTPVGAADDVADYIDGSYELFLGRGATAGDIDYWRSTVEYGRRAQFTDALAESPEWAGVRVDELYRRVLRRPSDAEGRAFWLDRIRRGLHLEDIAADFYGSAEYFSRANRSNHTFVNNLFRDLLGRPADAGGRNYWVGRINAGWSRTQVAAGFYNSSESRDDRVRTLYHEVLGRGPDPSGHAYWADRLRRLGDIALSSHLAASPEFYKRITGVAPSPRPPRLVYTYDVRGRNNTGSLEAFAAAAERTLGNPLGWSLGGSIEFRRVSSGGQFTLWLASPGSMTGFASGCSPDYSCRVGRNVIINERPWNNATPSWHGGGGTLPNYRRMVLNHEVGHWLGFGHSNCGGAGHPAPVMQQQSISMQGCAVNAWPTGAERRRLANTRGVPIYG